MYTGVSIKAGAAFLAGVMLALGGAFTYFKVTNRPVAPSQSEARVAESHPSVPVLNSVDKPSSPSSSQVKTAQEKAQSDQTFSPDVPRAPAPRPNSPSKPTMPSAITGRATPRSLQAANVPKVFMPKPRVTSRPISLSVAKSPIQYAQVPVQSPSAAAPSDLPALSAQEVVPPTQQTVAPLPQVSLQPTQAPPPQPHTVTIPADTTLSVRLTEKLSTDHNYTGDTFRATLDSPLVVGGFIIADRGAKVLGRIVKSEKAGRMEGTAELSLTLTQISTTDGQQIDVQTNDSLRTGPSNTGRNIEKMGGGAALGAIIGAIAGGGKGAAIGAGAGGAAGTGAVLFGHGKAAVVENETRLTFQLSNATTITEKLN